MFAFAAAGTGGHVYPALAVADALVADGVDRSDIVFIGGNRMEATAVPAAGYEFVGVEIQGLRRSLSKENLKLPGQVWRSSRRIAETLKSRGTRVMTAFGGYVSVPAAWAARRSDVKLFVHEQNAVPGLANRMISRGAERTFVAFPEAIGTLNKVEVVGNPLRPQFAEFDRAALRAEAMERYRLPGGVPVLGVLGGSLGARVLNEVAGTIAATHDPDRLAIVHLTGRAMHDDVASRSVGSPVQWRAVDFEDRMDLFYAACDLVLSRAGALTVSELTATGTPGIVVPYAAGTAGHQAANVASLGDRGGVVVIPETSIDQVPVIVEQLMTDPSRRAAMAEASRKQGRPHAAETMARQLREAAGG
jgi:UDP-N-acetylglucosamine--N-acetylmuramyl-(pentapeptide) pyrophosphoryl-undecaprenol N-acetylglucosamine transferase